MFRFRFFFIVAATALLAGCGESSRNERSTASVPAQNANQQIFQVKGIVIEVMPEEKSVKIKHEEIPGYMAAMTMNFDVRDTNELAGMEAGHPVSFRLTVTDTEGWIDQMVVTGPKTNVLPTTGPFRLVREVELLNEGDPLPEYRFTNQFGKAFSTTDFKGRALAINFLFTRCPYPTYCPFLSKSFSETQKRLLARSGGPTNWHLLTISFDPEFDSPQVLKSYGELNRYHPEFWTLATGELIDITAIGEQFGLTFWRDAEAGGGINHNLRTVVIDASGKVRKIFTGNEWTVDELVDEMVKAAGK